MYWFLFRPVTVGVHCVILCDDQVLLIRNTYGRGRWTVPGGGLKPGETPEEAVRREVAEEVGLTLGAVQPLGRFQGREDHRHDTVHVFAAQVEARSCTIDPGEILAARWFVVNALPPLADYAQQTFALWRKHQGHD